MFFNESNSIGYKYFPFWGRTINPELNFLRIRATAKFLKFKIIGKALFNDVITIAPESSNLGIVSLLARAILDKACLNNAIFI